MDTEYRDIPEFPGRRVGNDGTVWKLTDAAGWEQLKTTVCGSLQYPRVSLGRGKGRYVHRLILEVFVGPCPDGMECRHLDGNPQNNRLDNLAWGTPEENCEDREKHRTEESRARLGTAWRGKKLSEEHRAKMSAAHRGKTGRHHSEETKAKIAAARREYWRLRKQSA